MKAKSDKSVTPDKIVAPTVAEDEETFDNMMEPVDQDAEEENTLAEQQVLMIAKTPGELKFPTDEEIQQHKLRGHAEY